MKKKKRLAQIAEKAGALKSKLSQEVISLGEFLKLRGLYKIQSGDGALLLSHYCSHMAIDEPKLHSPKTQTSSQNN